MRAFTVSASITTILALTGCDDGSGSATTGEGQASVVAESSTPAAVSPTSSNAAETATSVATAAPVADNAGLPAFPGCVTFDPPNISFGVVPPATESSGSVRILNGCDQPLEIVRAITSCGCTSTDELKGRVIPAGESTEFAASMTMKSGLGLKREKVTIWFDGYPQAPLIYYFQAEVSLPLRVEPPHIDALERTMGTMRVYSQDNEPFSILGAGGRAPEFVRFNPATDPPRNRYTLNWDLTEMEASGGIPWFWVIETDREDCPVVDIRIRHEETRVVRAIRRWTSKDQRILVGNVRAGEPIEISTKIEYGKKFSPEPETATVSDGTEFQVSLLEAQVDGQILQYRIELVPKPGPVGLIYEKLTIGASGGENTLRVIGRRVE